MKFQITVNQCVSLTKCSWPNEDHLGTINLIRMSQFSHFTPNIFKKNISRAFVPRCGIYFKAPSCINQFITRMQIPSYCGVIGHCKDTIWYRLAC